MICPSTLGLQVINATHKFTKAENVSWALTMQCKLDECASYDTDKKQCEIKSIRQALEKLATTGMPVRVTK